MFEQSPLIGPGTGSVTQHTLEILLLLAGAFLLGMLLHWLLSRPTALKVRQQAIELMRLKERLHTAERRPQPSARLRESNSTEHERTLQQLRDSREAEARAKERIIELEGRIALLESAQPMPATPPPALPESLLPFLPSADKPRKK